MIMCTTFDHTKDVTDPIQAENWLKTIEQTFIYCQILEDSHLYHFYVAKQCWALVGHHSMYRGFNSDDLGSFLWNFSKQIFLIFCLLLKNERIRPTASR